MASPMAVAVMTKKALELAEDKRVRTLLASIVAGIIVVMLIPLLVMVSIFNTQAGFSQEVARIVFDGGPIPTDIDAELSKAMEEMIDAFEELDQTIESLEVEGFDDIKVKSFFISSILQRIQQTLMKNSMKALWIVLWVKKKMTRFMRNWKATFPIRLRKQKRWKFEIYICLSNMDMPRQIKLQAFLGKPSMMKLLQNSCRKPQNISAFLTNGAEVLRKPASIVPALYVGYIPIPESITCPEQQHSRFITSVHRCQKTRLSREIWCFLQEHIRAAIP